MIAGTVVIREATGDDAASMREIFNHEVKYSTASWEWFPLSSDDWMAWFEEHTSSDHAVLVAEVDGSIAGFAGYGAFRTKAGYVSTVEDSVYLREEYRGLGLGKLLLKKLMDVAKSKQVHTMVAAVTSENVASIHMHESVGFVEVGCLPQVGHKFGRWLDLTLMEIILDKREAPSAG